MDKNPEQVVIDMRGLLILLYLGLNPMRVRK